MGEEEHTDEEWSLSWFLEPFAGSRGGLDTALPSSEDFERLLDVAEGQGDAERGES
jgi:hypothetical protein